MKAAIVIDVPEGVEDVTCIYTDNKGFTQQAFYKVKPLPQKKPVNTNDLLANAEAFGWNVCLYVITGETK